MLKSEIIEKIENIANNADESQTRLNALNLLLNYEIAVEKEEEAKQRQKESNEKFKNKMNGLTDLLAGLGD